MRDRRKQIAYFTDESKQTACTTDGSRDLIRVRGQGITRVGKAGGNRDKKCVGSQGSNTDMHVRAWPGG